MNRKTRKTKTMWVSILVPAILAVGCPLLFAAEPTSVVKAQPFPLDRVTLLDSPFTKAMEVNRAYLHKLDPDRLLWPYHERAGMPTKGERYGGWAKRDCVGQISGHYLSACALMYASTGDEELKKRLAYMVAELAKVQAKHGNGYAGPVRPEVWKATFSGQFKVGQWGLAGGYVPWYVLHKTFAGLMDVYTCTGNEQALEVARKFADWAKRGTDNLSDEQFQKMLQCEHGGMNEAMANLYALTGNRDYLALARRFDHKRAFASLEAERDDLQGKHANTLIPKIVGAARLYELTDEKRYATIARFFWDRVVEKRSYAQGGVDFHERFRAAGAEAGKDGKFLSWDSCETCCVYNMLKLTRHRFGCQPDARYMDYYERALYNHILGSQDPASGGKTYFYSLKPGHFKIYSTPFNSMWCCVGTGIENHSKYGDTIYFHNGDTLWVNLFIPSELAWEEKGVTVRQETGFPREETTTLTVSAKRPRKFALRVRVPFWAKEGAEVRVNGKKVKSEAEPQTYLSLSRTWKDGDKVEVRLPMSLHLYRARDDESRVVVMYGPLVLAGALGREGMPENLCCVSNSKYSGDPDPPVPVLVTEAKDPDSWVKRTGGKDLEFRTQNVGRPEDVSLIPVGLLHHQRYTVYWKTMTPKEWKARERISVEPVKVAKDKLKPGLAYEYYEGTWKQLPDFSALKPVKEGVSADIDLSPKQRNDNFGLVYTGFLKVAKAGRYCFALKSDDGSRLWIGGQKIVDHDGLHPATVKVGPFLPLKTGYYPLKLHYFENIYHEGLEVLWYSGSGSGWQRLPSDALFH